MDLQRDNLGFMLSDVWRLIKRVFDDALKGSGLTLAQARALLYISTHQGIRQVELAELLEVGQMTLASLLDELASAGLVERRTDPNDGRVNQMFLSAEGLRQIRTVEKVADVVRIRAMQGLNEEQINGAYKALRSMRDNLASTASLFDNTESSAKRKKRAARILPGTILATSKEKSLRMGRDGATRTPRR